MFLQTSLKPTRLRIRSAARFIRNDERDVLLRKASRDGAAGGAIAAGFPEKDITFIVPYKPGGGSDAQARRLQAGLEKHLGVKIRIIYKTGGGGAVGFNELYRSKPDGYTISNVVVPNIIVTSTGKDVGYKPGDFAYIGMTEKSVGALAVNKNSKFKSLEELVAFAKQNPGKLTIAGVGSTGHANYAEMVKALGITATYVPISGGVGRPSSGPRHRA